MTPEERTGLQVQLENALLLIAVGGCTCETKTAEVQHHKERCHYRVACEAMPLVERLAAEVPPTRSGWDPEVGFILEAANEGELAAYESAACGMMGALAEILDGKDDGAGVSNDPWETLRRRVLALMAKAAT